MQNNTLKLIHSEINLPDFRDLVKRLPQIALLYIFLFQPPFISRTAYFLLEAGLFFIYVAYQPGVFYELFKKFKTESLFFLIIIIYTFVRDGFKGEEVFIFRFVSWAFQCFFFAMVVIAFTRETEKTNTSPPSNVFSLSFWAIILAAFTSILLLLNGPLNDFYRSLIIIDPYETSQFESYRIRGFGIGESLTFTFAYLMGFMAGYIIYILNHKKLYSFFLPFLLLAIIFNARIGLLPLLFFLLLLPFKKKGWYNLLLIFGSAVLLLLVLLLLPDLPLYAYLQQNSLWIASAFYEFSSLFSGQGSSDNGSLYILFHEAIQFPKDLGGWLFGEGINLYFPPPGRTNSDIGYINQLNYGGLIFIFLLLGLFWYMVARLSNKFGFRFWFTILFTLSILFLNYKGSAFASTPGSRFLYMMYIYLIHISTPNKKDEKAGPEAQKSLEEETP